MSEIINVNMNIDDLKMWITRRLTNTMTRRERTQQTTSLHSNGEKTKYMMTKELLEKCQI